MDFTLILLVVVLIIVAVLFVVALRAGGRGRGEQIGDQGQGQQQAPERPAIAAPHGQGGQGPQGGADQGTQGQGGADQEMQSQDQGQPGREAVNTSDVEPGQVTITTTTTTREVASPASVGAEVAPTRAAASDAPASFSVSSAPDASGTVAASAQAAREPASADDRVIVRGARVVEADRVVATNTIPAHAASLASGQSGANAGSVRYTADVPPATVVAAPAPPVETSSIDAFLPDGAPRGRTTASVAGAAAEVTAAPVQTPTAPDGARSAPNTAGTSASMELVGQPPTRTGVVMLSVAPQRLPYRLAELLGEQRGLEEAITLAHRRIDDIELGPDPGSAESRVRLGVLREDLTQKQERLREILFLQDGYRWLQQHMAPDRAADES